MSSEFGSSMFSGSKEADSPVPESAVELRQPAPETHQDAAEFEHRRKQLIREINEQIPFLAYGLSEKLADSGLRGKVSVRGVMGESWGVGVSKNNPRKDIPNIVTYPESILDQDRWVTNAQLRHNIGHLNHSIDVELGQLQVWCEQKGVNYQLILPLAEAIQTASIDYLEMQNSIADNPAEAFRPLYTDVIDMRSVAENIGEGMPYKQAVDLTLIKALSSAGLVPDSVPQVASERASSDVLSSFNPKTQSIIEQAIKSSSGRIKVQLVRDYLWPELSKHITPEQLVAKEDGRDLNGKLTESQKMVEILQKNQQFTPEESERRQEANSELLRELAQNLQELQNRQAEELEKLQELINQLNNPENVDENEQLENLEYKIHEIGINEQGLTDEQRELLGRMREFCQKTTVLYVKTMRFLMQEYQQYNPNFTDEMIEKMILRHHDTPSFTIYGKDAGKDFIENQSSELGIEQFETDGFLLNYNLPDIIGRFWYRGGNGKLSQPVPEGAIEWGHFYRACMPVIWRSVDATILQKMIFNRINEFGQHDYRKYYYLYDVNNFPYDMSRDFAGNDQQSEENDADDAGTEQGDGSGQGGGGSIMDSLRDLQRSLNNGSNPEISKQIQDLIDKMRQEMPQDDSEHESEGQGGVSNKRELGELFGQLQDIQEKLKSSFERNDGETIPLQEYDINDSDLESSTVEAIENLESIKEQQRRQLEALYREQSGLSGEALDRYIDYREETRDFTSDLVEFFTEKFKLDTDYNHANNQRRGARLQKDWIDKMLGMRAARPVIEPAIFERKSIPKSPRFVWSLIMDNSRSTSGKIIEQERKTTVALVEVAKQLQIPLEILIFQGGEGGGYRFLKTFDQDLHGDDLSKLTLIEADTGNSDAETLQAACQSVTEYADQFNRSYNFLYFLTDGLTTVGGPVLPVIEKHKRDIVITGIGMAGAASTIGATFGKNSVGVEDVSQLSDVLIRKIEDQIEETFD